jgi:serine protease Do
MGVMVRNMDGEVASIYRLPVGAYVDSVEPGGAADRAGIQAGDIILSLGDVTISNITDLTRALRDYKAGQSGAITVYREGRRLEITVVFDEKAQQQTAVPETEPQAQPETQPEATMPNGGSFEDWFNYFSPFGNNGG